MPILEEIARLARKIGIRALYGHRVYLEALEMLSRGEFTSNIARKLGVATSRVRGWRREIGSDFLLTRVVPIILEVAKKIDPVMEWKDGYVLCKLCGARLEPFDRTTWPTACYMHLVLKHRDFVKETLKGFINEVMQRVLEELKVGRGRI